VFFFFFFEKKGKRVYLDCCFLLRLGVLRQGSMEVLARDVGNEGVELVVSVFALVALALDLNANARRHALDAMRPDGLIQRSIEANVASAHHRLRELSDLLDGLGSTVLEGRAVQAFVQVDGVNSRTTEADESENLNERRQRRDAT